MCLFQLSEDTCELEPVETSPEAILRFLRSQHALGPRHACEALRGNQYRASSPIRSADGGSNSRQTDLALASCEGFIHGSDERRQWDGESER
jgi:hypothetical protein